jgi:hypothetical protein
MKALEIIFKRGGIVFELDTQLCLYTGGDNIEMVDSIINAQLKNGYDFERILTTSHKVPFGRRLD